MVEQITPNMEVSVAFAQPTVRAPRESSSEIPKVAPVQMPEALSPEGMKEVIEVANAALKGAENSLRFQIDDSLENPIVTVVDQTSGEIIRQLPSEEIVRIARSIDSMRGVLFDAIT